MISRVILPLLVIPMLILAVLGSGSYYWYNQTYTTFQVRSELYRRLEAAKNELKILEPLELELTRLSQRFNEVDYPGSLDAVKLYLSKKSNPAQGVKLEDYRRLSQVPTAKNYGSISLKFTCRSEALVLYLAEAMNTYPNLILTQWDMEANQQNKLLQFNSTAVLGKITNK